jgi:uncharacterized protein
MGLSFFSKAPKFLEMFIDQNDLLLIAADSLLDLFMDFTYIGDKCGRINSAEKSGKDISRNITKELSKALVTSIDRENIHAINSLQEELLNSLKAISSRISLYKSEGIYKAAIELIDYLRDMIIETSNMLMLLKINKTTDDNYVKIQNIKGDSELLLLVALGELFEKDVKDHRETMIIMIWLQIYERIENALETTLDLAKAIEEVSIKNS